MFYPPALLDRARANMARHGWAAAARDRIAAAASPWLAMSDEQLWSLMFGPTITRSWMVWSNGHCPSCQRDVPMYNWKIDALAEPWKLACPHCAARFPTNDFAAFYHSGLGPDGVFDPALADRTLLFNAEHPDPADPHHRFGVDDGEGYVEGEKRWRFVGAYLIYGQWKQAIVAGATRLAEAYLLTGDRRYAHRCGVLLGRVADLYPSFDFISQAFIYEKPARELNCNGYVSTWHDACEETRELAMAYAAVREALADEPALAAFLDAQARRHDLPSRHATAADMCRHIEQGILRDAIVCRKKVWSNYPRTDLLMCQLYAIFDWPGNRNTVETMLESAIIRATRVDGLTGEKGLTAYSVLTMQTLAEVLALFDRAEPSFLDGIRQRQPRLRDAYRFVIDTECLGRYQPHVGDCGYFAGPDERFIGLRLRQQAGVEPSMYSFLWRLYQTSGEPAFLQVMHRSNGGRADGLPHDLFADDPEAVQREVSRIVAAHGPRPHVGSVNKTRWRLAILRGGEGEHQRAAWLDYDAGGAHGHADGLNLGLFARGLDLMPDLGYPPVNFGGWAAPRALWYTHTAAHNTVVVDGQTQTPWTLNTLNGETTLWALGRHARAMRASGAAIAFPGAAGGPRQFERTVLMVDLDEADSYLLDVFRVVGGAEHAKFQHSHFGTLSTRGLTLASADDWRPDENVQMRCFRTDPDARGGWSAQWKVEDRYQLLPAGTDVRLRHIDLTAHAEASTCEGWVLAGLYDTEATHEAWIPRLMVRRRAEPASEPLASTFVAVIEPGGPEPKLRAVRRLPLATRDGVPFPEAHVAVEVELAGGGSDLLLAADAENPRGQRPCLDDGPLVQPDWAAHLHGHLLAARHDAAGSLRWLLLGAATSARVGELSVELKRPADIELTFDGPTVRISAGAARDIHAITRRGEAVTWR